MRRKMKVYEEKVQCPICKKNVSRMAKGYGALFRHTISKGIVCKGSWRRPIFNEMTGEITGLSERVYI